MNTTYILTGSNMGDSLGYLNQAIAHIDSRIGNIKNTSSVYRSEPWGNKNQQDFMNQVLEVQTKFTPVELLSAVLNIEQEMGRNRIEKWGPRVIDLDILFYDSLVINLKDLVIPHPYLHERRFTLMPLNEIAPGFVHPTLHQTITELLNQCRDTGNVVKV